MILITKTTSGILLQRDGTEIVIDGPAVAAALPSVLAELLDHSVATQLARRQGYEDGLLQGRMNAAIEAATRDRIADRQTNDLVEALQGVGLANAA